MLRTLTHTIISLPLKLMVKSIVGLPFKGLLFAAVCLVTSHSLYAQSLTEQLEQGLGLSPAPQKPAAQSAPNTAKLPQSADDFLNSQQQDSQQNLADQIETLKQAMVNLNRDLFILEEDLLFPSSTQVAVYLSMDVGEYFGLDAVEIRVNGEVKTYYLYTERQVNALYRGGVQRLYVGNVNQGDHELTAYFVGIGPENREYKRAVSVKFTKDEDPVALELSVIDSTSKQQPLFEAKVL
jgi:hypothetical protein